MKFFDTSVPGRTQGMEEGGCGGEIQRVKDFYQQHYSVENKQTNNILKQFHLKAVSS